MTKQIRSQKYVSTIFLRMRYAARIFGKGLAVAAGDPSPFPASNRIQPRKADRPRAAAKGPIAGILLAAFLTLPVLVHAAGNPDCDVTVTGGSSIQSALDSADSGDVICVAPGTFQEDLLMATPHVTLVASDSVRSPVIDGSGNAILVTSADSVRIRGLEIRGASRGIRLENSDGVAIIDNTITGNDWGIHDATGSVHALVSGNTITDNEVRGIHFRDSEQATITGNTIRNNASGSTGFGISLNISGASTITGNHFEDNSGQAIRAEGSNLLIANNTFRGHPHAIDLLQTSGIRADDARVAHNVFIDNEIGLNIQSARVEVDSNTFSGGAIDLKLSRAENAVITDNTMDAGLSLNLAASTDIRMAYFDHQMSGNSVGGGTLFFARDTTSPEIPDNAEQIFLFNVSDAEIRDMSFENLAGGIVVGYGDGISITGNELDSLSGMALAVWMTDDLTIEDNTLTRNGHMRSRPAIKVVASPETTIESNSITENNTSAISLANSSNSVIQNNVVSGNSGQGIFVSSTSHNVSTLNNIVQDNVAGGIQYFGSCENGLIAGNTVTGNGDAGIMDDGQGNTSDGTTISDNVVIRNEQGGIDFRSDNVTITGNTVRGNEGIIFGAVASGNDSFLAANTITGNSRVGIYAGSGSTVRDNLIADNSNGGIMFRISDNVSAIANQIQNNRGIGISVSSSENARVDSNSVSGHTADLFLYDQSKNALVQHNSFDTGVILDSFDGRFSELNHTFVNNTLRDDRPLFFVRNANRPDIPEDAGQIIIVSSSNVDISGFEFTGVAAGVQIVHSTNVHITDNTFDSNLSSVGSIRRAPVTVWSTDSVRVEENTFVENVGTAIQIFQSPGAWVAGNQGRSNQYAGTYFSESPHASFLNNTFVRSSFRGLEIVRSDSMYVTGNTITGSKWEGIHISNSHGVRLDSNTVSQNERSGMFLESSDSLIIQGNTIAENGESGLESHFGFRSSDYVTIAGNSITGNQEHGILFEVDGAHVTDNTLRDNQFGISLDRPDVVTGNKIIRSRQHGLQIRDGSRGPAVHQNYILGNDPGLVYTGEEPLNATENWWGQASGPGGGASDPETGVTADGSGDEVSANVRFDPWLTRDPFEETETSADDEQQLPATFALEQNYPNPFNPSTLIRFHLPRDARVRLEIYTVVGERVATAVDAHRPAGSHEISFDASHLSSGVYLYRLQAGDYIQTRKMMLVK